MSDFKVKCRYKDRKGIFMRRDKVNYYLDLADVVSQRGTCLRRRYGAVIVKNDEVIATEENLLSNATMITVDDAPALVESFGGICYPAHIDREANGIVATLGVFPEFPFFPCTEYHDGDKRPEYESKFELLKARPFVVSSDAHYLWDISGRLNKFELEGGSADEGRKQLFEKLKG